MYSSVKVSTELWILHLSPQSGVSYVWWHVQDIYFAQSRLQLLISRNLKLSETGEMWEPGAGMGAHQNQRWSEAMGLVCQLPLSQPSLRDTFSSGTSSPVTASIAPQRVWLQ